MALDVAVPDPPDLDGPADPGDYDAVDEPEDRVGDDYRREELAGFLREGAWADGFEEWTTHTSLTEEEFEVVLDLGLIDDLDFYWHPADEEVGYRAPTLPETLEGLDPGDVDAIEEALDELGRTVSEALENEYVVRDGEEFGFFADR